MRGWKRSSIALLVSSVVASNAFAVAEGFYMGLMMGPSSSTGGDQQVKTSSGTPATTTVTPRSNQFGTRLFLGNKFSQYAGFELGGTFFSSIAYNNKGVDTCAGTTARVRDVDIVGKGEYTFQNTVGVFAKGGVAVTYLTTSGGLNSSATECGKNKQEIKYRPTVTVGASYDLNQNWVVDASWNRIMVGSIVNNVDFYALGISYHFVDKYCGQFLC